MDLTRLLASNQNSLRHCFAQKHGWRHHSRSAHRAIQQPLPYLVIRSRHSPRMSDNQADDRKYTIPSRRGGSQLSAAFVF